jgi:hypothetical protein
LLLCGYTIVPLRFLIPFLSFAGCMNVLIAMRREVFGSTLSAVCGLLLLCILWQEYKVHNLYEDKARKYNEISVKLLRLDSEFKRSEPIVINSVVPVNYFPVKPLARLYKQHAVFLSFYLFSADDYQIRTWKELCHCNTFSLKERVNYIVAHQALFLIDDKAYNFIQKYFLLKYRLNLKRSVIKNFDGNTKVCTLTYIKEID